MTTKSALIGIALLLQMTLLAQVAVMSPEAQISVITCGTGKNCILHLGIVHFV
ncbi:MAG: hypothetical protein U5K51_03905 [Flavobacteriaceae bacterium]|nr:hypothetical protein [Flavobacteriaceae bacterium]